jgi:outer membrane protein TolC
MRAPTAALALLLLAPLGCVSTSAGRAEADAIVRERTGIERRASPDDAETARARSELLSRPLTADAAARLAVLSHPDVDAAYAAIGVARGALVRAVTLPNPEVEAAMTFHDGERDVDLGLTIDVTDLVRLPAAEGAASGDLEAASIEAAGLAMDAALEARRAFYAFVAARQVLELRKTAAFALSQGAEAARRMLEAGNTAPLDAATQQAMYEESRLLVARAQTDVVAARERLSAAIGAYGVEASRWRVLPSRLPSPTADEPPLDRAEQAALDRSLDLRALKARYAAASGRADLAAWSWFPAIEAGAVLEREDGEWAVGPQVGVAIPIFDHGQGAAAVAEAQRDGARARLRSVALQVRAAARTLATRVRNAREQAVFYEQTLLPLRQRVLDDTQLQYNAMNVGIFQLLAAKRDQIEAGRAYVEALRDYWTARTEMDLLLAGHLVAPSAATASSAMPAATGGDGHGP